MEEGLRDPIRDRVYPNLRRNYQPAIAGCLADFHLPADGHLLAAVGRAGYLLCGGATLSASHVCLKMHF